MRLRFLMILFAGQILAGCASYRLVREIKLVGFEEDVSKGKSLGEIEGGDCVFHILGYWLGGQPTLSRALANARKMRTSTISDSGGGDVSGTNQVRYLNNVAVNNDGFNAVVFGKQCIMVRGLGFL